MMKELEAQREKLKEDIIYQDSRVNTGILINKDTPASDALQQLADIKKKVDQLVSRDKMLSEYMKLMEMKEVKQFREL